MSTGQNLAMGYENWTQAIEGWIEEKEHYFHGYPATGIVGHYTQVNRIFGKEHNIQNYFLLSLDDMAFSSISWLCSYNVSSIWAIHYSMAFLCL